MSTPSADHAELTALDLGHLRAAARLAWRGHGLVEPNPMVGCLITAADGDIVGRGYHRTFGGPHAEIHALRMAGNRARGGTCYVTLEPCHHAGKTGPCSEAIIEHGVARVVIGQADPNPTAAGGAQRLRDAGIETVLTNQCPEAKAVSEPFVHRVRTKLPWVTVKWAQTLDGRVATRTGESQWISGPASRLLVHRKRAKVDAILTGIGTVLSDDPMLTARHVRCRRTARRVIIDPKLDIPMDSAIARSAEVIPTTVACLADAREQAADRVHRLLDRGVEVCDFPADHGGGLPLRPLLHQLVSAYDATNVLVEAGPGLISRLCTGGLAQELWTFTAPMLLGDVEAMSPLHGRDAARLTERIELELLELRQRGGDVCARYRVKGPEPINAETVHYST